MENIFGQYSELILASVLAFVAAFASIPVVIYYSVRKNLLDKPDHRKLHKAPIPTMGGLGIFTGIVASSFVWLRLLPLAEALAISISVVLLVATGALDDMLDLSALKRLFIQLSTGILAVYVGLVIHFPTGFMNIAHMPLLIEKIFTVIVVAGVANSFNLIDGIDGLAGGLGFINASIFGGIFLYLGNLQYAIVAFSLAMALIAFLKYNFNPARIFMGDTGSVVLGYLMAIFAIKTIDLSHTHVEQNTLFILSISLLMVPVIDTCRVFTFRLLKRKSPFSADRTHIHHLLLKTGFNHKKASLILYLGNITLFIEAYLLRNLTTLAAIAILSISAVLLIELLSIKRIIRIRTRVKSIYKQYETLSSDNHLLFKYLNEQEK
jgi:UDP-GlcNAc:undecaprenyl-phosphate/decaprenyl-phosphate GlcNAc-1-phosphate transferase